ncbi:hypothetical protein [Streptomyces hydrogenans]|uniref:hypothetical protein n=1 Tax=Streptomyces hydrogenans TaxID=1873719 RepID=UPI0035DD3584
MIGARIFGHFTDEGTVRGTIVGVGGRFDDIKAIRWDDGAISHVGEHERGPVWDYQD